MGVVHTSQPPSVGGLQMDGSCTASADGEPGLAIRVTCSDEFRQLPPDPLPASRFRGSVSPDLGPYLLRECKVPHERIRGSLIRQQRFTHLRQHVVHVCRRPDRASSLDETLRV